MAYTCLYTTHSSNLSYLFQLFFYRLRNETSESAAGTKKTTTTTTTTPSTTTLQLASFEDETTNEPRQAVNNALIASNTPPVKLSNETFNGSTSTEEFKLIRVCVVQVYSSNSVFISLEW